MIFALCDCNNFFVSCERLFRPDLAAKPVVVLSSNDGCVISRSNEAKALGIAMGVPFFKIAAFLRARGVTAFSSNFALYQEISRRVMAVLSRFTDRMETYSVDEAFLSFSIAGLADPVAYARDIRQAVAREVGIPVSIGIAPTKTLAKLASAAAKKCHGRKGYFPPGRSRTWTVSWKRYPSRTSGDRQALRRSPRPVRDPDSPPFPRYPGGLASPPLYRQGVSTRPGN